MKSENKYGRKGAINMGKVEGDAKATNLAVAKRRLRYLVSVAVVCALLSVPVMADGGGDMGEEYPILYAYAPRPEYPISYAYAPRPKRYLHVEEEKAVGDGYYRRVMDYESDNLGPHEAQMIERMFKQGSENSQEDNLETAGSKETENAWTNIVGTGVAIIGAIVAVFCGLSSLISSSRGDEVSNEFSIRKTGMYYKNRMAMDSRNPKGLRYRRKDRKGR